MTGKIVISSAITQLLQMCGNIDEIDQFVTRTVTFLSELISNRILLIQLFSFLFFFLSFFNDTVFAVICNQNLLNINRNVFVCMYMFSTFAEVNNIFYNFFSIWLYFYNKRQQKYHKSTKKLSAEIFLHHKFLILWYLIYVKYMLYLQVQCHTSREF